ncbi:CAP domain-containing protein [Nitratifractor salsuginis]|uniref:SCP-like extracellular n=1 Tax=Nitratifractor salsuginis (strain DSM 16511 / JCM 12458 / E9I37-1) TaxID=749222 RepID=E6X048_NITSE|nr:CAP domain-containing protein [Nitratifractor salsuginis]ADV46771.1 SCP-like extracellular [Nitratifractor salsuginis DSM 16511]
MRYLLAISLLFSLSLPVLGFDRGGAKAVNLLRRSAGMIPLKNDYTLSRSAYHHAKYLGRLHRKGHLERPGSAYYTGRTPFDRMVQAGYPSRAGVENISYGDSTYTHSVGVLMSTLYHRLAFLDFRIDSLGSSEYGNRRGRIYVYDMASSAVAKLCREHPKGGGREVYGVCANGQGLPLGPFRQALAEVERRNPALVLWPPPGARRVPRTFIRETPDPIPGIYHAGYPVTVQFNPARYRRVRMKSFRLLDGKGRVVPSKILTSRNDPHHKLSPYEFALIPLRRLAPHTRYTAVFTGTADNKRIEKRWQFTTGG